MAFPDGYSINSLYGMGQQNPEEMDEIEAIMRRLRAASSEVQSGGGASSMPFAGLMVQGGQKFAEAPDPVMTDAPKRAPKSAEAPSTSGWSPRMEPTAPLEERATPQNMRVPQTAPIVQTPRQAEATKMDGGGNAPRVPEPDFWDRLGAFSRGYNTGGLVGAIADGFGSGLDRQVAAQNQTAQALVKMGVAPELASIAIRNPEIMKAILAQTLGGNVPDIKEIEQKDEYGRVSKVPVIYNRATRRYERLNLDGTPAASPAQPASAPAAPQAPMAPAAPTGQTPPAAAPKAAPPPPLFQERPVNINTLPAPARGYVYDRGPKGYPLFDAQNNPKMIPEKELESRSAATDDAFKLRETIGGIDKTFRLANEIANHPGLPGIAGRAFGGEAEIKGVGVDIGDIYPGTSEADAFNKHQTLLSDVALRTMDQLKAASAQGATGFGALSEKELAILQSSAGNLRLSSTFEELEKNYRRFQDLLMRARQRLLDKYEEKYGNIPEGIMPRQQLIDDVTSGALSDVGQTRTRPRRIGPFDIPFTSTTDAPPDPNPPDPDAGRFFPSLGGNSAAPTPQARGIPNQPPPGARDLPPNSGYPPGSKATRNPNNPNEWIIWEPD